ncbi:O-antigen ligase family protein [Dasania marina]|uniref:O-antigen ligase family protein n=1 Tax=Dasania marina TaxID=471499 RepID=UPI0030D6ECEA
MEKNSELVPIEDFYSLKIKSIWNHVKDEGFSFWMICCYLFFEYVRPQSIIPALDFLPWAQLFIIFSGVGWLFEKNRRWVGVPANKWMVIFFIVIILSSLFGMSPATSYSRLADFYLWLIIYFLIINIVTTEKRLFVFLLIFIVASFKLSLFGAKTWAFRGFGFTKWGIMGPPGFFQNSGELAIQMLIFFGLSWYFYIAIRKYLTGVRLFLVRLFSVTAAMTVLGASSRGGQLGLVVQILMTGRVKVRFLAGIICVGMLGFWLMPQEQIERFQSIGEDKTSIQRMMYWENGWEMMKDNPVLGVGYYNFQPYYERYYPNDLLYKRAQLPHNIFIQVGADLGFTGLIVYLILIGQVFITGRRVRAICDKDSFIYLISKGVEVGFVGFIVAGLFVSVTYYPFMWIQLAIMSSISNIAKGAASDQG